MAYVENVAAVVAHARTFGPGVHVYNYADKPDLDMNHLVALANDAFGRTDTPRRLPYAIGLAIGHGFDLAARLLRRNFRISAEETLSTEDEVRAAVSNGTESLEAYDEYGKF